MTTLEMNEAAKGLGLRAKITRIHASVLIPLGLALGIGAIAGGLWGGGMYPFLVTNHIAAVGLLQAYLLMALIGVSVWIGTLSKPMPRAWHWVAIAAHCVPLLAVVLFVGNTAEMTINFVMISLAIHAVGIGSELLAVTRRGD